MTGRDVIYECLNGFCPRLNFLLKIDIFSRPARPLNNRRRHFIKKQDPNAPNFFYKRAEDIPGYQKFTLDEVIHPEKEEKSADKAAKKSDDVPEEDLEFVDTEKKEEEHKKESEVKSA